jgi:outer membrane protein assembly factor BamB
MRIIILLWSVLFVLNSSLIKAQNIGQWRGPNRDGIFEGKNLLKEWPETGPELIGVIEGIGKGFSSPVISNGIIYTTGNEGSQDILTSIDQEGNIRWQVDYGSSWNRSYPDTRSTPTVEDQRIYVISGQGEIVSMDIHTGQKVWSVDAYRKYEGQHGEWGIAESLLLVDDKVIYTPGGNKTTIVAINKMTGKTAWQSESLKDTTAYVSPLLIYYDEKKIIINITANFLFGVDAKDGKMLWKYKYTNIDPPTFHPLAPVINAITPLYHDRQIYITSGYDHVGAMFRLSNNGSEIHFLWKDSTLDCHIGGVVLVDGYIYGSNWQNNSNGNWCCLNWNTGKILYEKKWQCKGSIIYSDGMLYCYEERRGHVALVNPTPDDFQIISTFRITQGTGPHWARPVIDHGRLYIRHGDVLMVYNIQDKQS